MKKLHAQWLTVQKTEIDQDAAIEILWQTAPNTLHLLISRISHGGPGTRPCLATEEIGPYHCLAELRQQLCMRFGELPAQRICHPSSWLPPGIPATACKAQGSRQIVAPGALHSVAAKQRKIHRSFCRLGGRLRLGRS